MYVELTSIPRTIRTICNATYISDTWRLLFYLNAFCVSKVWAIKYFLAFEAQKKIFFITLVSKFRPHSRSFKNHRIPINLFHSKFLLLSQTSLIFNWTLDKMNFTNELKSLSLYFALRMSLISYFIHLFVYYFLKLRMCSHPWGI